MKELIEKKKEMEGSLQVGAGVPLTIVKPNHSPWHLGKKNQHVWQWNASRNWWPEYGLPLAQLALLFGRSNLTIFSMSAKGQVSKWISLL